MKPLNFENKISIKKGLDSLQIDIISFFSKKARSTRYLKKLLYPFGKDLTFELSTNKFNSIRNCILNGADVTEEIGEFRSIAEVLFVPQVLSNMGRLIKPKNTKGNIETIYTLPHFIHSLTANKQEIINKLYVDCLLAQIDDENTNRFSVFEVLIKEGASPLFEMLKRLEPEKYASSYRIFIQEIIKQEKIDSSSSFFDFENLSLLELEKIKTLIQKQGGENFSSSLHQKIEDNLTKKKLTNTPQSAVLHFKKSRL